MGNQAQVHEGATGHVHQHRNFPNRLGKNTNVFLAQPERRPCVQAGQAARKAGVPGWHQRDHCKADQIYRT